MTPIKEAIELRRQRAELSRRLNHPTPADLAESDRAATEAWEAFNSLQLSATPKTSSPQPGPASPASKQ